MSYLTKLAKKFGFVPVEVSDTVYRELAITKLENEALKKLLAQKQADNKVLVDTVKKLVG